MSYQFVNNTVFNAVGTGATTGGSLGLLLTLTMH